MQLLILYCYDIYSWLESTPACLVWNFYLDSVWRDIGKAEWKGEKKGKLIRGRADKESEGGQLIFPCMVLSLGW